MHPICWLHISDIHLTARDVWSQDIVLRALCDHMARQRGSGTAADFIMVTGDLAFSGKVEEYALAAGFLDALSAASGVPRRLMFTIPGNHDVDRDRQKLCFVGARASLENQSRVDALLTGGEDLETLLKRQENYRRFESSYFAAQDRTWTPDGMGYVSRLTVDNIRVAVIGLNSAWLAEGGLVDHGKLLIGERQVIDALRLAQEVVDPPHVVVAMAHHPLHLLQEFDRVPVLNRIEAGCHFLHCGHLHEPEARPGGLSAAGCLTLTAGASFSTRQSHNTYSIVTLNLLHAERAVTTIQYNPSTGEFVAAAPTAYPMEVRPSGQCTIGDLAQALRRHHAALAPRAYYLAALLLEQKAELPIPAQGGHVFGSFAVLVAQPMSALRQSTVEFMAFRNVLRVLYGRVSLAEILARYGDAVSRYGIGLDGACNADAALRIRLAEQERDVEAFAAEPQRPVSHTAALLTELAEAGDWPLLRDNARRYLDSPNRAVAQQARRMLALALAHFEEHADRAVAIELYQSLLAEGAAEVTDVGNLVNLLAEDGQHREARATLLRGIRMFPPSRSDYFFQIGQRLAAAAGDRAFRREIEAAMAERGQRA